MEAEDAMRIDTLIAFYTDAMAADDPERVVRRARELTLELEGLASPVQDAGARAMRIVDSADVPSQAECLGILEDLRAARARAATYWPEDDGSDDERPRNRNEPR